MSIIDEVISYKDVANYELEMCCETLCHKQYVFDYIHQLEHKILLLEDELHGYRIANRRPPQS